MHRSGAPGRTFAAVCASGVLPAGAVVAAPVAHYLTRVRVFFDAGQRRAVFEVPTHVRQREQPTRVLDMRLLRVDDPVTVSVTVR
jgi:hypothetical protein